MSITKEKYGTLKNGEEVYLYKMDNQKGLEAEILSYGGIIRCLTFTKNGKKTDVVLGRDTMEANIINKGHYGAAIGRFANRIENSEFVLNGKTYKVGKNNGENSLHGGIVGFDKQNWKGEIVDDNTLCLYFSSPDGEEGFPGNLELKMTYTLTCENSLLIHYEATCDKDTLANFTNHSYFNLNGHGNGTVYNHTLQIDADFYTPAREDCIPTGEIAKVDGTPFDFKTPQKLGEKILSDFEQIKMFGGFDHNFVLNGTGFRKVATLTGDISGIIMETYTDKPGMQIYSGNGIVNDEFSKEKKEYNVHGAVCLETQFFPAGPSYSHFPSCLLKAGDKYDYKTEYKFM